MRKRMMRTMMWLGCLILPVAGGCLAPCSNLVEALAVLGPSLRIGDLDVCHWQILLSDGFNVLNNTFNTLWGYGPIYLSAADAQVLVDFLDAYDLQTMQDLVDAINNNSIAESEGPPELVALLP
jgi:hypothetical protein